MVHVLFWLYIVALLSGSASISIALAAYGRHRKAVVLWFALFLASLGLILTSMALQTYAAIVSPADEYGVVVVGLVAMVVGAGAYMFVAPFFYHALLGERPVGWLRLVYLVLAGLFVPLSATVLVWPDFMPTLLTLNVLLFGMVAYGIIYLAVRYTRIGDRRLRRAVRVFLIVSAIFFPLMYLDSILNYLPEMRVVELFDGMALPVFFLTLNVLAVRFAATYLSEPPYLADGRISNHFREAYGISEREGDIIRMLVDGRTNREAAEQLFISAKTVENHVYNIYQKTQVRNRVELVNLILEHRA